MVWAEDVTPHPVEMPFHPARICTHCKAVLTRAGPAFVNSQ